MTKIKELRKNKKITQEELAQKMNVTQKCISSWEVGRTSPSIEKIIKLAEIFDVKIENLCIEEKKG